MIEQLAINQASPKALEEWAAFKSWLADVQVSWDVIVDGANVGHSDQNFLNGCFSHARIDAVLEKCAAAGRKAVVVLRRRWVRSDSDFTVPAVKPKRKSLPQVQGVVSVGALPALFESPCPLTSLSGATVPIAEKWAAEGQLIISPSCINDDWVALYIALTMCLRGVSDVQFVTNDKLRDHFWRMHSSQPFKYWCESHLTRFEISGDRANREADQLEQVYGVSLLPPLPFSICSQRGHEGCWHFPIDDQKLPPDEDSTEETCTSDVQRQWLVALRPHMGTAPTATACLGQG